MSPWNWRRADLFLTTQQPFGCPATAMEKARAVPVLLNDCRRLNVFRLQTNQGSLKIYKIKRTSASRSMFSGFRSLKQTKTYLQLYLVLCFSCLSSYERNEHNMQQFLCRVSGTASTSFVAIKQWMCNVNATINEWKVRIKMGTMVAYESKRRKRSKITKRCAIVIKQANTHFMQSASRF